MVDNVLGDSSILAKWQFGYFLVIGSDLPHRRLLHRGCEPPFPSYHRNFAGYRLCCPWQIHSITGLAIENPMAFSYKIFLIICLQNYGSIKSCIFAFLSLISYGLLFNIVSFLPMNRLQYFLHAKTLYNIHSPFVFNLYREVLFAKVNALRSDLPSSFSHRSSDLVFKLQDYYRLSRISIVDDCILLHNQSTIGSVLVVDGPHQSSAAENKWEQLCADPFYRVSIDLFDVGLLFSFSHLAPQHFILR